MNPAKAELKMGVLHDVGVRMDDKLDEASRRLHAHGGAKQALRIVAKNISTLAEIVKKDMDNEVLPVEQLKIAEYVNKMISRACEMCLGAAQHQENLEITAQGAVQALEEVVATLKKDIDQEETKIRNFREAIASGEVTIEDDGSASAPEGRGRPSGMRPGMSIAAQRKAEAEAEKAQEATEEPQEVTEEPQEVVAEEKPQKRRRGRRKKE